MIDYNKKIMLNYTSILNSGNKNCYIINKTKLFLFLFCFVIFIQISFFILLYKIYNVSNDFISDNDNFNEFTNTQYISQQKFFCENQEIFNNTVLESKIKVVTAKINDLNFSMFVYKKNGFISEAISRKGFIESKETNSIFKALDYYSNKMQLTKNNIYVLDIGANIGWYTFILGKAGYNILSFEPSKLNFYILLKNYCLNNDINATIINKGLDIIEKNITLYHPMNDIGNGVAFDGSDLLNLTNPIKEEIRITKLSQYISFLKTKNLALIKLDIEGSEGKAIEGGLDLITKYHIPFVVMEWIPKYIKLKGTDPKSLLELFINNGYKLSVKDFLSKQYISINKLLKTNRKNIYMTYAKILEF